jgi:hypothetical protein
MATPDKSPLDRNADSDSHRQHTILAASAVRPARSREEDLSQCGEVGDRASLGRWCLAVLTATILWRRQTSSKIGAVACCILERHNKQTGRR